MGLRWIVRGRRRAAVVVLGAMLTAVAARPAAAAAGAGQGPGASPFAWPMPPEIAQPSADPAVAQRQAMGCTVVGLGMAGMAVASGALAAAGTGGPGAVPVSAVLGEIITYFGAGCTIGAYLAVLFPVPPQAPPVEDIGG